MNTSFINTMVPNCISLQLLVNILSNLTQLLVLNFINAENVSDEVSAAQYLALSEGIKKIKGTISQLSSDHKDLHGSVSKVGKSIDRVWRFLACIIHINLVFFKCVK